MKADGEGKAEKAKGKKRKGGGERRKLDNRLHRVEQVHWQTRQKLCEAFFRVTAVVVVVGKAGLMVMGLEAVVGLGGAGLVEEPSPELRSIRYEHRLAPFACLAYPPFIPYPQYLDMSGHAFLP